MLLTKKNLESLLEHPQPFVILVFPRLAHPTLVPSEYFVLKNLSLYEGKKGVEKGSTSKSTPTFPTAVAPLSILVAKPSAKKNQFHSTEEPVVIPSGSTLSSQLPPITTMDMPTREELDKLLNDPEQSFIIRVLFGTPNNIIEAVMLMKSWGLKPSEVAQPSVPKTVTTATQRHAKERSNFFRKVELENEVLQMEVCSLKLDNTSLGSSKAQMKEKSTRLKLELEQVRVGIVKENKELKAAYQKQVDDYGWLTTSSGVQSIHPAQRGLFAFQRQLRFRTSSKPWVRCHLDTGTTETPGAHDSCAPITRPS
ncbi:hypothetical protein CK203_111349 [Vitis vinifera]|uniref:Uncharacterized protein n=1 Tax=Vitis vinifera TaxID=29760 RepID=A0A438DGZ3_VITVI|nr:hypothetical protein CK203_111349 [Vitis vinifera]